MIGTQWWWQVFGQSWKWHPGTSSKCWMLKHWHSVQSLPMSAESKRLWVYECRLEARWISDEGNEVNRPYSLVLRCLSKAPPNVTVMALSDKKQSNLHCNSGWGNGAKEWFPLPIAFTRAHWFLLGAAANYCNAWKADWEKKMGLKARRCHCATIHER